MLRQVVERFESLRHCRRTHDDQLRAGQVCRLALVRPPRDEGNVPIQRNRDPTWRKRVAPPTSSVWIFAPNARQDSLRPVACIGRPDNPAFLKNF
jgi:hypothetical protein